MHENALDFRDAPVDHAHLRRALGRFATGVMVATTRTASGRIEGLTANSFSAVSLDPPLVLWSLQRQAPSLQSFLDAGRFAVSVLADHQQAVSQQFATPSADKFAGIRHVPGLGGCPLITDCLATFECVTEVVHDAGDHVLFIGRVERASYGEGRPLVFAIGAYGAHEPFNKANPMACASERAPQRIQGAYA
jgi:flavin reductase (DIM6/NTAB) family NADH-FMN oxidoreductase RutF